MFDVLQRLRTAGLASLFTVLTLAGCGGGGGGSTPSPQPAPAPTPTVSAAITGQPADQSVVVGSTATFTVVATDASTYQWQVSSDSGTTYTDVAGATAASYTTAATALGDSGRQYRAVAANSVGAATSNAATLLVTSTLLFGGEGGANPVLRAWDKKTGSVVAEIQLPGPTTGFPVTYTKAGRQYIAVAVRVGDAVEIVALARQATAPGGR